MLRDQKIVKVNEKVKESGVVSNMNMQMSLVSGEETSEYSDDESEGCVFCENPEIFRKKFHFLVYRALFTKYCASEIEERYKDYNDLVSNKRTFKVVSFKEEIKYNDTREFLGKYYSKGGHKGKLLQLTKYYKFHKDIPSIFMLPFSNLVNQYNIKKRKFEMIIVSKIIKDELIRENKLDQLQYMNLVEEKSFSEIVELSSKLIQNKVLMGMGSFFKKKTEKIQDKNNIFRLLLSKDLDNNILVIDKTISSRSKLNNNNTSAQDSSRFNAEETVRELKQAIGKIQKKQQVKANMSKLLNKKLSIVTHETEEQELQNYQQQQQQQQQQQKFIQGPIYTPNSKSSLVKTSCSSQNRVNLNIMMKKGNNINNNQKIQEELRMKLQYQQQQQQYEVKRKCTEEMVTKETESSGTIRLNTQASRGKYSPKVNNNTNNNINIKMKLYEISNNNNSSLLRQNALQIKKQINNSNGNSKIRFCSNSPTHNNNNNNNLEVTKSIITRDSSNKQRRNLTFDGNEPGQMAVINVNRLQNNNNNSNNNNNGSNMIYIKNQLMCLNSQIFNQEQVLQRIYGPQNMKQQQQQQQKRKVALSLQKSQSKSQSSFNGRIATVQQQAKSKSPVNSQGNLNQQKKMLKIFQKIPFNRNGSGIYQKNRSIDFTGNSGILQNVANYNKQMRLYTDADYILKNFQSQPKIKLGRSASLNIQGQQIQQLNRKKRHKKNAKSQAQLLLNGDYYRKNTVPSLDYNAYNNHQGAEILTMTPAHLQIQNHKKSNSKIRCKTPIQNKTDFQPKINNNLQIQFNKFRQVTNSHLLKKNLQKQSLNKKKKY